MFDEKKLGAYVEKILSTQPNVVFKEFRFSKSLSYYADDLVFVADIEDKGKTSNFAYGDCSLRITLDNKGMLQEFTVTLRGYDEKTEEYCKSLYSDWDSFDEAKKKEIRDTYHHAIFYNKAREYFEFPTDFSEYVSQDDEQIKEALMECAKSKYLGLSEDDVENGFEHSQPMLIYHNSEGSEITCQRIGVGTILYVFKFAFQRGNFVYEQNFSTGFADRITMELTNMYYELKGQGWKDEANVINEILAGFGVEIYD